jgi:uncharacterized protein YhfF
VTTTGHDPVAAFVDEVRAATRHRGRVQAFAFGDTPELAQELADLVRSGPKRATAGWVRDAAAQEQPRPGDLWVVLDGAGLPACAIRTDEVTVRRFGDADPAFAWDEGEGDRTLEDWRHQHLRFFHRRAATVGIPFDDDEPVQFERFSLVHPAPPQPQPLLEREGIVVRVLAPDERPWVRALLGSRADSLAVLEATGGFPADACPALLARHHGRTAGVLAFRPAPDGVTVAATVVLEELAGIEAALHAALDTLQRHYGWRQDRAGAGGAVS